MSRAGSCKLLIPQNSTAQIDPPREGDTLPVPPGTADLIEIPVAGPNLPALTSASGELSNPFVSNSRPIDSRVSVKMKQKIRNHEFVDFGALLVNPTAPPRYRVSLDNNDAQLTLESADKLLK